MVTQKKIFAKISFFYSKVFYSDSRILAYSDRAFAFLPNIKCIKESSVEAITFENNSPH